MVADSEVILFGNVSVTSARTVRTRRRGYLTKIDKGLIAI